MIFQQFRHEQGACLSYLLGCTQTGSAAVMDSQLDVQPYLDFAKSHRLKITHIFETHSQADHLSGALKLSRVTGAPIHMYESVQAGMPVTKLKDGQELNVGNIKLKILHTPGHTQDSICILITDLTRSEKPWLLLSGDTLFVGDTGRPDLDGSADQLYDSIWGKLLKLEDWVEIYPTHFAGSVCGKAMSPKTSSTIGFERLFNPALQKKSKKDFVEFVNANLPIQPPRFRQVRKFNLGFIKDPPLDRTYDVTDLQITPEEMKAKIDAGEQFLLIDVREKWENDASNIGGTLIPMMEIPDRAKELDPNQEIIVYCRTGNRSDKVVEYLYESGFKRVKNLVGGIFAWSEKIDPKVPKY